MKMILTVLLVVFVSHSYAKENGYLAEMKKQYKFKEARVYTSSNNVESLVGTDLAGFKILSVADGSITMNYSECNYDTRAFDKSKISPTFEYDCTHVTPELCNFLIPTNSNGPLDKIEENLSKIESCKNINAEMSQELSKFFEGKDSKKYLEQVKSNNDLISNFRTNSGIKNLKVNSWRDSAKNMLINAGNRFDNFASNYNNALDPEKLKALKENSNSFNGTFNTFNALKKAKDLCYQYGFRNRDNILALRSVESDGRPAGTGRFNNK